MCPWQKRHLAALHVVSETHCPLLHSVASLPCKSLLWCMSILPSWWIVRIMIVHDWSYRQTWLKHAPICAHRIQRRCLQRFPLPTAVALANAAQFLDLRIGSMALPRPMKFGPALPDVRETKSEHRLWLLTQWSQWYCRFVMHNVIYTSLYHVIHKISYKFI